MNNLQLLIDRINTSCDTVEANQCIVKSYIETIDKENNRISQSLGHLENLFSSKKKCKIIPFVKPSVLTPKNNNNPALRVSLI